MNDTHIEYSFSRNIMIFAILMFIYLLKKFDKELQWDEYNKKQKVIFYEIILVLCITCFIAISNIIPDIHLYDNEVNYRLNFLNAQIESILNKKASILLQPTESFLNLDNPFDASIIKGEYEDYSLYNGKLYSYFGIT